MKIIFIDIDGTLINYQGRLPQDAVQAVQKTRKNGNRVYLTTGRCKAEISEAVRNIGFDGIIGSNGIYIEDNGTVIQSLAIPGPLSARAFRWMNSNGTGFYFQSPDGLFAGSGFMSSLNECIGAAAAERMKTAHPEMIFEAAPEGHPAEKINFCLRPGLLEEAHSLFDAALQVGSWSVSGEKQDFGEFSLPGTNKVQAVRVLLKYLSATGDDTFAFGDAESDRLMIEYCNTGIAMGNAPDSVKLSADYVTDDVDSGGLFHAFARFNLI